MEVFDACGLAKTREWGGGKEGKTSTAAGTFSFNGALTQLSASNCQCGWNDGHEVASKDKVVCSPRLITKTLVQTTITKATYRLCQDGNISTTRRGDAAQDIHQVNNALVQQRWLLCSSVVCAASTAVNTQTTTMPAPLEPGYADTVRL